MKLTTVTNVSVDGVMQGLGGRDEDRRDGFERGSGSWGAEGGASPISTALNTRPKYVASNTLTGPDWGETTVIRGDLAIQVYRPSGPPRYAAQEEP